MSAAAPVLGSSPRLLRPWCDTSDDALALSAGWADSEVQRHLDVPAKRSPDVAKRWIAGRGGRSTTVDLAIEIDGTVVGEVGVSQINRDRGTALVGWWLLADHRGAGHATWAVDTLTEWLLGPFGLARLAAIIGPSNRESIAVAQRCGFRFGTTTANGSLVYELLIGSGKV